MSVPAKLIYFAIIFLVFYIYYSCGYFHSQQYDDDKKCFCELKGSINDCSCTVDTVDYFNNVKIFPRLKSLLLKDFFRFYKVNLKNECPFWHDDSKCVMRFCRVKSCSEADIPPGIKGAASIENPAFKYTAPGNSEESDCRKDFDEKLGYLNTSISEAAHEEFRKWADHDEAEDDFCISDDQQHEAEYVDLLLNPERYTGYKGKSAHKIWSSIYLENCFDSNTQINKKLTYVPNEMKFSCLEQRAFYRLISGLHTSINIHLCSKYLLSQNNDFLNPNGVWGPNINEFQKRFSPETTNKQGAYYLKNLYFLYLVELRALAKASPYLKTEEYFTGNAEEDHEVKLAVSDILSLVEKFPSHFNENKLFSSGIESMKLKSEFKEKFRNISRIMDCVGCDKCKLWGKLQTQGLGTALKILYSDKFNTIIGPHSSEKYSKDNVTPHLTRTEIVSLFNAFGRLSNSIFELENFRKILR
ncbi:ero1-like protein [Condylostylus longicornis]|uniref:ero1-like protein n=1 Tax=Condylostylus longicornis TaxID=2530218 RepID=UPI00244DC9F7|nr:ero1-like protein [Condylostylus longicornis]